MVSKVADTPVDLHLYIFTYSFGVAELLFFLS